MEQPKTTTPKTFCFVLMPFDNSFRDIYELGIRGACDNAGAYCERVDEQVFRDRILDQIYNQIAKADVIIADMTGKNPNVFYEVGYAHALGKPTILVTRQADDIPFDLKHFPHIIYGERIVELREELTKRVRWHIENPPTGGRTLGIEIEVFCGSENLALGNVVWEFGFKGYPGAEITVHNASPHTFGDEEFMIGVLSGPEFQGVGDRMTTTSLPDGRRLHMLQSFEILLPDFFASYGFEIKPESGYPTVEGQEIPVVIRVYTRMGARDFPLTLKRGKKPQGDA